MPENHTGSTKASSDQPETAGDDRRFTPPDTARWPARWQTPTVADLARLEAGYRRGLLPVHVRLLHELVPPLAVGSAEAAHVAERLSVAARREADAAQGHMVGLAAPQVGIPARALLFDPRVDPAGGALPADDLRCVVNPEVEPIGDDLIREIEGCLSTGPIKGWVQRATRVRLRGHTPHGEPIDEVHTGLAAIVIQHEVDHLDGILFPQRISEDLDLLWVCTEHVQRFTEYARAHRRGETPEWKTRTPRDQWDAIRAGLAVLGSLSGAV